MGAQACERRFPDGSLIDASVFALADTQGTTLEVIDGDPAPGNTTFAQPLRERQYDSFGNRTLDAAAPGQSSAAVPASLLSHWAYTGRQVDATTGLNYHRARWYDPQAGKWIHQDPSGYDGGGDANLYRYVGNQPLVNIDPSGLQKSDNNNSSAKHGANTQAHQQEHDGPTIGQDPYAPTDEEFNYERYGELREKQRTGQLNPWWRFMERWALADMEKKWNNIRDRKIHEEMIRRKMEGKGTVGKIWAWGTTSLYHGGPTGFEAVWDIAMGAAAAKGGSKIPPTPPASQPGKVWGQQTTTSPTGPKSNIPQASTGNDAANRASFEMYKASLRAKMSRPIVKDAKLNTLMDELYRDNATVGSGSTADAVRKELATGEKVGGKLHSQKAEDYSKALKDWLAKNPNALPGDRAAAENVLKDMDNALSGERYE